jgi:hypothetical protein
MTIELVFLVAMLWVFLGLIDAWVLREIGRPGWRWIFMCALAGPLSLSFVYDWIDLVDPNEAETNPSTAIDTTRIPTEYEESSTEEPVEWPRDDPRGPFMLQGYRGLCDH